MDANLFQGLVIALLIIIFLVIYFGIGLIIYLATMSDDEPTWKFKDRARIILGYPYYAIRILTKGFPKPK